MYTVALAVCEVDVVAVTVWLPAVVGGEYSPVVVIVPEAPDPPTTLSTSQVTVPLPFNVVNCWVNVDVSTVTLGLTSKPVPVPVSEMVCGLVGALFVMVTIALLLPVVVGVNAMLIVQLAAGARVVEQSLV